MTSFSDVSRMGFGAMQLSGPHVFGPPADRDECVRVLRSRGRARRRPHRHQRLLRPPRHQRDHPRGAARPTPTTCCWSPRSARAATTPGPGCRRSPPTRSARAVHDNLTRLGVERIGAVNLRVMEGHDGPDHRAVGGARRAAGRGQDRRARPVDGRAPSSLAEVEAIAPVACVQNAYNIAQRDDDAFVDDLAARGIAYVPYFPLGGFTPVRPDRARRRRGVVRRDRAAGGAGLAAAALAQRAAHPGHQQGRAPGGEPRRRRPGALGRRRRRLDALHPTGARPSGAGRCRLAALEHRVGDAVVDGGRRGEHQVAVGVVGAAARRRRPCGG